MNERGPTRVRVHPAFRARLALVLPNRAERQAWMAREIPAIADTLINHWAELPEVPEQPGWRRLALVVAEPGALEGVVLIDAAPVERDPELIEIRAIATEPV